MKRILFISTHNFATNPRLVKEIGLALKNKYEVSVLCCSFNNWSKTNNEKIKQRLMPRINYYEVPGNRLPFVPWLLSSFWFSLSILLLFIFPENIYLLSLRSNKRSWLLLKHLKKIKEKINLVIAHNPGSFYPAQKFAKENKIPFGIDLEDYHPGESNDKKESEYLKSLLKNILPKASCITAASPLILEETKKDTGALNCVSKVVLNYFSQSEFIKPELKNSEKLLLTWFSQNISYNRGLEKIIPFVEKNKNMELHLFGNCNEKFKNEWLLNPENIFIHPSVPQNELHKQLSIYDIGLAIEPGKDLNNELAISNKMLAYFQSGLYIVASDTKAQRKFIEEYPEHGILTSLDTNDLEIAFQKLLENKNTSRLSAKQRFQTAGNYSWENESQKLLQNWKQELLKIVPEQFKS